MTKTEILKQSAKKSTNPLRAIACMCWICYGEESPKQCVDAECPLYDFRLGRNPRKRPVSEEARERCRKMSLSQIQTKNKEDSISVCA